MYPASWEGMGVEPLEPDVAYQSCGVTAEVRSRQFWEMVFRLTR